MSQLREKTHISRAVGRGFHSRRKGMQMEIGDHTIRVVLGPDNGCWAECSCGWTDWGRPRSEIAAATRAADKHVDENKNLTN